MSGDGTMDDFIYNSSYSSGWKRIKREETEKEHQRVIDILQKDPAVLASISRQIPESVSPISIKTPGNTSSMLAFEENQKEIIDKINQLQNELAAMKQLLNDIQTNTEMIKAPNQKHATGSKLSRFFK
jgi:Tfp pilus assembly protein PilN